MVMNELFNQSNIFALATASSDINDDIIKQLVMIWVIVFVGAFFVGAYLIWKQKLKSSGKYEKKQQQMKLNRFFWYRNNVFCRARIRRIEEQISSLSCYDVDTIRCETVDTFEKAVLMSLAIPIAVGILMEDVIIGFLTLFVSYVYYDISIDKQYDKICKKIIGNMTSLISNTRERYIETLSVPTAIQQAEKHPMLEEPMKRVVGILTATDAYDKLIEFCKMAPIRVIKTFAVVSYIINDIGDTEKPDGSSAFKGHLTMLRQEVDAEERKLEQTRIAFKSLPIVSLIGLFTMPLYCLYLLTQIPGTSLYLKGTYGVVCEVLVVVSTIIVYYVISIISRPSVVNQSDRTTGIDNMLGHRWFKQLVKDIQPKKFKKRDKWILRIKNSLSQKDINYIYAQKLAYSVGGVVVGFIATILFLISLRGAIYNNYTSLSFANTAEIEERVFRQIVIADKEYLALDEPLPDVDLQVWFRGKVRGLSDFEYTQQFERIQKKYKAYKGLQFKWYFCLVSITIGWICWFIPEFQIILRKSLIKYEVSDDVMQLMTICIVLADTKLDVYDALRWLELQSVIHKEAIRFASIEFTSNPVLALENLKSKSTSKEFKNIVSELMAANDKLSIADAFSEVVLDKQQFLLLREMLQKEDIESKKNTAKLISVLPAALAILLLFMLPILILGITQLLESFSGAGQMIK